MKGRKAAPRTWLFAGSFDPPHLGHLDLIRRAAGLCDRLIVAVADNPEKRGGAAAPRIDLLRTACAGLANVEVTAFGGATVAYARSRGCCALLRGLRNGADLEHERGMAEVNRRFGLDTVLLATSSATSHLSSRLVRAVAAAGLPVSGLVPPAVARALRRS